MKRKSKKLYSDVGKKGFLSTHSLVFVLFLVLGCIHEKALDQGLSDAHCVLQARHHADVVPLTDAA